MKHEHDWKISGTEIGILGGFGVDVVWRCVKRGCYGTRTEQLRIRKPRKDALTDLERSERAQEKTRAKRAKEEAKAPRSHASGTVRNDGDEDIAPFEDWLHAPYERRSGALTERELAFTAELLSTLTR